MRKPNYINVKEFLVNSPEEKPKGVFLLAHTADAGMATPFLETYAKGVVASGVRVVRFHFPFMEDILRSGLAISPGKKKILTQCFNEVITHCIEKERCPSKSIIIGGKGMGSRIASSIADEHNVAGVICLSYPFYPVDHPYKLKQSRNEHLKTIQTPTLICQGQFDRSGMKKVVKNYILSKSIKLHWLSKCDNDFRPGVLSDRTQEDNLEDVIRTSIEFINKLL